MNGERVWEFAWAGAVVATIALGAGLPRLDPWKSYRPFFEDVLRYREGRQIVTTFDGVNRLPLITYYLRSRVEVVSDSEVALERLRGAEPVGAVIRREECAEHSEELAAIPGVLVTDALGRGRLCFAANQL